MYGIFGSEVRKRESYAGDDDDQQKLINHDVGYPDAASSRIQAGYAMQAHVRSVSESSQRQLPSIQRGVNGGAKTLTKPRMFGS